MSVTREGKRFLLAVIVTGFAALNTGNNLMYLIFSMMLSVLLFSILVPMVNLRGLFISFDIEEPLFAKRTSSLDLIVSNKKRFLPSSSFRFSIPGIAPEGYYIGSVPPGGMRCSRHMITFPGRGVYTIRDTVLSTEFPFIFFSFRKRPEGKAQVIVYPELHDVSDTIEELRYYSDEQTGITRGTGEDFFSLKPFKYGDSLKNVHWKATAKTGKIIVKEFRTNEPDRVTILLDNLSSGRADLFERSVSFAASLASEFIHRGYALRLLTCRKTIPFGTGVEHLYKILDILAILRLHEEINCPVDENTGGLGVLILSSWTSPLMRYSSLFDRIFYAGDL